MLASVCYLGAALTCGLAGCLDGLVEVLGCVVEVLACSPWLSAPQQRVGSSCCSYKSLRPPGWVLGLCRGVWLAAAALCNLEHWNIFACCSDSLVFLSLALCSLVLSQEFMSAKVAQVMCPYAGNTFLTLHCNHGYLFSFKFLSLRFNAIFRHHAVLTNVRVVPDTIRELWHDKDWLK